MTRSRANRSVTTSSNEAGGPIFERLEERILLSMLGIVPDYPRIGFSAPNDSAFVYDANLDVLTLNASPTSMRLSPADPNKTIAAPKALTFEIQVDSTGQVIGGIVGDDLVLTGRYDVDGGGISDPNFNGYELDGVLLTAEILDVGYEDLSTIIDTMDFRFQVTGGQLVDLGYWPSAAGDPNTPQDLGITMTLNESSFTDWTTNFSARPGGQMGAIEPIAPPAEPAISIIRTTNGDDADAAPGPLVAAGDTVTFNYFVSNDGNVSLSNVVVVDDNGTPGDTSDDLIPTFVSGDNGNGLLDEGEVWSYTLDVTAGVGQHAFTASVWAEDANSTVVTAQDPSHYFGVDSSIDVELSTNGEDADSPTGPNIAAGDLVTWTYLLTNTGNVALTGINLTDDNGTAGDTNDDFAPTYVSGDDGNGVLDVGETWTYTASASAVAGQFANVASASATDVLNEVVGDSDASHYLGFEPTGTLSGRVYHDANNDGDDLGDAGLDGVLIELVRESDGVVVDTTTTSGGGYYSFADVAPDVYTIRQAATPEGYLDGRESDGSLGNGTVDNTQDSDAITGIELGAGEDGTGYRFGEILPSSLSGVVFEDFNDDGEVDLGEAGLAAVDIQVVGTDDRGNAVNLTTATDEDGLYVLANLRPGSYAITQTQPTTHNDGKDKVGTVGASNSSGGFSTINDTFSTIDLDQNEDGLNYNFAERRIGEFVQSDQAGSVLFWHNWRGQNLLKSLNGGSSATDLGNWLASEFPNLYGSGSVNLAGMTNAEIAKLYQKTRFKILSLEAHVLATAFSVYVTNQALAGTVAEAYGFDTEAGGGLGIATWSVGSLGEAFGVADNTVLSVWDMLKLTNDLSYNGRIWDVDASGSLNWNESLMRLEMLLHYSVLTAVGHV